MKPNYAAWDIKIEDFFSCKTNADRLAFLIQLAVLAPSSHNSQPWKFKIENDSILVLAEEKRRLKISDHNDRQLFISLGCAIENLVIAGDYYSLSPLVSFSPYSGSNFFAAKISFTLTRPVSKNPEHLVFAIPKRVTNRNKYEKTPPSDEFQKKIIALSSEEISVSVINAPEKKMRVADAALAGMSEAMTDGAFRLELSHHVKNNLTKEKYGMPGFGLGFPLPISLIAPALLKRFNMSKMTRTKDEKLLKQHTPAFIVIASKSDNPRGWISAGRIYERIALLAAQNDIQTSVWAAPVQIGGHYKSLQDAVETKWRPQIFARMGYTKKVTPHSPRFSAEEVLDN